jgi:large subunit ribosomal protein L1
MVNEKILEAVRKARNTKKRNFKQTFDLAINLKNIDLKKPENRIKTEIFLPHGLGKKVIIGVIADTLLPQTKELEDVVVIRKDELESLGKDKKSVKKIAKKCLNFVAEAPLMSLVGKHLGQVLGPRNLMPTPVPPTVDLKSIVERKRKTVRVQLKNSPVIHLPVGSEDMKDEEIAENIEAALKTIIPILPKGKEQIKDIVIKLTMGKSVRVKNV